MRTLQKEKNNYIIMHPHDREVMTHLELARFMTKILVMTDDMVAPDTAYAGKSISCGRPGQDKSILCSIVLHKVDGASIVFSLETDRVTIYNTQSWRLALSLPEVITLCKLLDQAMPKVQDSWTYLKKEASDEES